MLPDTVTDVWKCGNLAMGRIHYINTGSRQVQVDTAPRKCQEDHLEDMLLLFEELNTQGSKDLYKPT